MNARTTPDRSTGLGRSPAALAGVVLMALAATAVLALVVRATAVPERVESVIVENGTVFHLRVDVSDGSGASWVRLGTVDASDAKTFPRVIDQGEVWRFRFHGQGMEGGEILVDRVRLQADGWTVRIPSSVEDALRDRGAIPPP